MSELLQSEERLKKSIIAVLLRLLHIDKNTSSSEFAYILKVAFNLGLTKADVDNVEKNIESYPLKAPANEQDRMTILYYLLFLMEIDGKVSKSEEIFVQEFGFKLGFRTTLTAELIEVIKEYASKRLPADAMLNRIRTYLN